MNMTYCKQQYALEEVHMFLLFSLMLSSKSYDPKRKGKLKNSIFVSWCNFAKLQGLAKQSRVVSSADISFENTKNRPELPMDKILYNEMYF